MRRHTTGLGRLGIAVAPLVAASAAVPTNAGATASAVANVGTRPNVLIILTDDQRYEGPGGTAGFLNFMPNVKKYMAGGGAQFTNAFATTSLCTPSRSSVMTGRYAHNTGTLVNGDSSPMTVFDQTTTLQARLQAAGYYTGLSGKYFNTWPQDMAPPYFDQFALTKGGYFNAGYNVNGVVGPRQGYTVTVTGNYALQFMQKFHADDPARPWYMYVAPQAPHGPYTPDTPYKSRTFGQWNGNPAVAETDKSDKPPIVQQNGTATLSQGNTRRVGQDRTLLSVDDMVGRLMTYLQTSGQLDNTIVIYASDNGMMWAEHGLLDKRYPYEQSVKVPLFLRWPGHVNGGSKWPRMVALQDIAPTVLDATGTPYDTAQIDGHDLIGPYKRTRMHLEYWRSPDDPDVPTWEGTWTPTTEYVQWYWDTNNDGTDDLAFREYYDLVSDPYQLTNLLNDGTTSNDPDVAPLQQQVEADQTCAGATCP